MRWLHVIAGIAWIGSSFYFVHLDFSLSPAGPAERRCTARPGRCTAAASTAWTSTWWRRRGCRNELTWFKWEAYATWLSGFALLVVVYYFGAQLYMIDPAVMALRLGRRC